MKHRLLRLLTAILCLLLIILTVLALPALMAEEADIPGLAAKDRVLLRIWMVDAPGGGQAWLKSQLKTFEKKHPGISTYLRTVPAEELAAPGAVLPDVVLCMPGNVAEPQTLFLPLSGDMVGRETSAIHEELLRCGRWQGQQYGLPLCWGAWVLCIDSALEPGSALTPAPTTLLGRPAATDSPTATTEPAYPLAEASQAECALRSPGGAALFTLAALLEKHPPLPEDFGTLDANEVYAAFQRRQCATAMLTTGQETALSALVSGGGGFPFRTMVPQEIITDQVWLASVTSAAPREAALLLAHLTSAEAQKALSTQGLHTVRDDLTLYAAGTPSRVEQAARLSLTAFNAYQDRENIRSAAWQFFQGTLEKSEALLPLL